MATTAVLLVIAPPRWHLPPGWLLDMGHTAVQMVVVGRTAVAVVAGAGGPGIPVAADVVA